MLFKLIAQRGETYVDKWRVLSFLLSQLGRLCSPGVCAVCCSLRGTGGGRTMSISVSVSVSVSVSTKPPRSGCCPIPSPAPTRPAYQRPRSSHSTVTRATSPHRVHACMHAFATCGNPTRPACNQTRNHQCNTTITYGLKSKSQRHVKSNTIVLQVFLYSQVPYLLALTHTHTHTQAHAKTDNNRVEKNDPTSATAQKEDT